MIKMISKKSIYEEQDTEKLVYSFEESLNNSTFQYALTLIIANIVVLSLVWPVQISNLILLPFLLLPCVYFIKLSPRFIKPSICIGYSLLLIFWLYVIYFGKPISTYILTHFILGNTIIICICIGRWGGLIYSSLFFALIVFSPSLWRKASIEATPQITIFTCTFIQLFLFYLFRRLNFSFNKVSKDFRFNKTSEILKSQDLNNCIEQLENTVSHLDNNNLKIVHEIRTSMNVISGLSTIPKLEGRAVATFCEQLSEEIKQLDSMVNSSLDLVAFNQNCGSLNTRLYSLMHFKKTIKDELLKLDDRITVSFLFSELDDIDFIKLDVNRLAYICFWLSKDACYYFDLSCPNITISGKVQKDGFYVINFVLDFFVNRESKASEFNNAILSSTYEEHFYGLKAATSALNLYESRLSIEHDEFFSSLNFLINVPSSRWCKIPELGSEKDFSEVGNVLIVDDNPLNIIILANYLKMNGVNADTCNSGEEAIRIAR